MRRDASHPCAWCVLVACVRLFHASGSVPTDGELAVAIQTYALDLELAGGESDVAPLVCLVTVEEPAGHPGAVRIEMALPGAVDTRQGRLSGQRRNPQWGNPQRGQLLSAALRRMQPPWRARGQGCPSDAT